LRRRDLGGLIAAIMPAEASMVKMRLEIIRVLLPEFLNLQGLRQASNCPVPRQGSLKTHPRTLKTSGSRSGCLQGSRTSDSSLSWSSCSCVGTHGWTVACGLLGLDLTLPYSRNGLHAILFPLPNLSMSPVC
jgi:hypothetical protein